MHISIYISISKIILVKYTTDIIDSLRLFSRICDNQLATWHTIFLGYVGLVSLASAVIILIMEQARISEGNYAREAAVLSYPKKIRILVNYILASIAIMIMIFLIHMASELPFLFVYITVILMVPTFYMLYKYLQVIFSAKTDSDSFKKEAERSLISMLKQDLKAKEKKERESGSSYSREILHVSLIIEDDILHARYRHALEALSWLTDVVVRVIPESLSVHEIRRISNTICTLRDILGRIIIEASASVNRGLLNSVLIQTELASQHFIKAGLSTSFHSLLDAYQLAMKEQHDSAIIEQYASCFAAFGNLKAAISVLEDNNEKLIFKLAVLNTTLVLICYSFTFPELGGSVIRLFQLLVQIDEHLTCSDTDENKDYSGLGCWIFVNAILSQIILSAPESELRNQAILLYTNMHHEVNNGMFPFRYIPEAAKDLIKHWDIIRKSSTGPSLSFCLRDYYPGFIERMIQSYIIKAVFLLALMSLEDIRSEICRVVKQLIEMNEVTYQKGHFEVIVKEAKEAKLIRDYDENVLQEIEEFISERNEE